MPYWSNGKRHPSDLLNNKKVRKNVLLLYKSISPSFMVLWIPPYSIWVNSYTSEYYLAMIYNHLIAAQSLVPWQIQHQQYFEISKFIFLYGIWTPKNWIQCWPKTRHASICIPSNQQAIDVIVFSVGGEGVKSETKRWESKSCTINSKRDHFSERGCGGWGHCSRNSKELREEIIHRRQEGNEVERLQF